MIKNNHRVALPRAQHVIAEKSLLLIESLDDYDSFMSAHGGSWFEMLFFGWKSIDQLTL